MAVSLFDRDKENEDSPTPSAGGGSLASFSTGMNTKGKPQDSGRFTNLQKYISANEGAGDLVSGRISNAVNSDYKAFEGDLNKSNQEISGKLGEAENTFNTTGTDYKDKMATFNQGLGSFQSMADRGSFDQTGQDLISFYNQNKTPFNNLATNQSFDEAKVGEMQKASETANTNMMGKVGRQNTDIQSEQGRYGLMKLAAPRFGGLTQGQNRLDQMFFQGTPNAVQGLQNTFKNQQAALANQQGQLTAQNARLGAVTTQEQELGNALKTAAMGNKDLFASKLGNQNVYDEVNAARKGLYDSYLGQLANKNINADLAQLLGIQNLGGTTYNPVAATPAAPTGKFAGANIGMGVLPTKTPSANSTLANQFRTYNAPLVSGAGNLNDPRTSDYLKLNSGASRMQDVMRQPEYETYQALLGLANTTDNNVSGVSTLAPAVSRGSKDLTTTVNENDRKFQELATKNFQGMGAAERSYQVNATGPINIGATNTKGQDRDLGSGNSGVSIGQSSNWYVPTTDTTLGLGLNAMIEHFNSLQDLFAGGTGTRALTTIDNNLNNYLYGNDNVTYGDKKNQQVTPDGDTSSREAAKQRATALAENSLSSYLQNLVDTTGVKNVATLNTNETLTPEQKRRFAGLL